LFLEGKGKTFFSHFPTFHPKIFYLICFPLILGFCITMVLDRYFAYFLPFPWPINCIHTSGCTKFSTHSLIAKLILIEDFFFISLNSWWRDDRGLWTSSCTNELKNASGIVPRFDTDPAPLWWRSHTVRSAPSSRSQTPLNLVLSDFFELLHFGDFVAGWPHF
jgi:hypothetical protein